MSLNITQALTLLLLTKITLAAHLGLHLIIFVTHTETFLKALQVYKDNFELLDKLTEQHYNPGAFDIFIDLIFALIGEPEVYSSEYTECLRNPIWRNSDHPIVHQFRDYYEKDDHFWT